MLSYREGRPDHCLLCYPSPQIFGSLGISADTTLLLQSLNSIVALIAQFFCVVFIDKLGRRSPLMVCNIISGCTFAVGAALQARFPNDGVNFNAKAGVAFVAMTWIFNAAFSFGVGPCEQKKQSSPSHCRHHH